MNAKEQLKSLLSPLCSTDADRQILAALCEAVVEVTSSTIVFQDNELEYEPGSAVAAGSGVPSSFLEIAKVTRSMSWDGGGPSVGYGIADDGTPAGDIDGFYHLKDNDPDTFQRIAKATPDGDPTPAFVYGQNWTYFDPTRKLKNGEPALAFISHESVEWEPVTSADELDYKQIFLRLIAKHMIDADELPELYC